MSRQALGARGEEYVAGYIQRQRMAVLERNYRCRLGEIDIIAKDGDTVAFIEVKTRSGSRFGSPAEAVTEAKKQKLLKAAYDYIASRDVGDVGLRFDVAEVFVQDNGFSINYIKNAFGE